MAIIPTTAAPESREDALMRLAGQARATGVKLFQDQSDGRFYASSRSQPGVLHRLTAWTCSCRGFTQRQRCSHLAALHSALGWLNVEPEPDPEKPAVSTATCGECGGHGEIQDMEVRQHGRFVMQWTNCPTCHGRGVPNETVVREVA